MDYEITGIKCDAEGCGWHDFSFKWDDFEKTAEEWLNKPCPKCGANLLTQEEVDSSRKMFFVMKELEKIVLEVSPSAGDDQKLMEIQLESDGTGKKNLSTEMLDFELTPDMIEMMEGMLKDDMGREMIKQQLLANKN